MIDQDKKKQLENRLIRAGFLHLGGFNKPSKIALPQLDNSEEVKSLLLIGSVGPILWPIFSTSREACDGQADPLDRYTKRHLSAIAKEFDLKALFPFEGPPYYPFQQWALECGGFSKSPIGVVAHCEYGPWPGFRAAFLSRERIDFQLHPSTPGPCEACTEKPCLNACPVDAISLDNGYDVSRCRSHLKEAAHEAVGPAALQEEHAPSASNTACLMTTLDFIWSALSPGKQESPCPTQLPQA